MTEEAISLMSNTTPKLSLIDTLTDNTLLHDIDVQNISAYLATLSEGNLLTVPKSTRLVKFVDGSHMACPMPLLKTKVALRDIFVGESLYVVATDPHSQADISAFCQQSSLNLLLNSTSTGTTLKSKNQASDRHSLEKLDTIFHFIITKTDSN